MEPTATTSAATGTRAGEGRVAYATAGRAARYVKHRAAGLPASGFDRRVLDAVLAFTTDWSKLADQVTTAQLAGFVGLDPDSRSNWSKVGAALGRWSRHGVILYRPGAGRHPSLVAVPEPPEGWADPTAGVTRRLGDPASPGRGGDPASPDGWVTNRGEAEERTEERTPRPPLRP